jgi:hypothetical protein
MTNTAATRPAYTLTGIVCAVCSHFDTDSGHRVQKRHASIAEVRRCQTTPRVPAPTVADMEAVFMAPGATALARFSAKCPKRGCSTHRVANRPFTLRCTNHGRTVYTASKQLFGTLSTATNHRCDARCTGAVGNVCVCACGGANHGIDMLIKL